MPRLLGVLFHLIVYISSCPQWPFDITSDTAICIKHVVMIGSWWCMLHTPIATCVQVTQTQPRL